MTVPAGFTTQVYDRAADGSLLPPLAAELPVGIDILGLPFSEPKLFEIGAAYEAAKHHRKPPPDFAALASETVPPKPPVVPEADAEAARLHARRAESHRARLNVRDLTMERST